MPVTPDPELHDLYAVTNRILQTRGPADLTLEAVAAEAGLDLEALQRRYDGATALLVDVGRRTYGALADAVTEHLEGARNGSDAIKRFVETQVSFFLDDPELFRGALVTRLMFGNEVLGFADPEVMKPIVQEVRRGVDPLERALLSDLGPSEQAGGIHPRRLAFTALIVSVGFSALRLVSGARGFLHSDRDLIDEITGALGTATTTLRHLSALNEVSNRLARMRSEQELTEALADMLGMALELAEPAFLCAEEGALPDDAPREARTAFDEDRVVVEKRATADGEVDDAVVAVPVRCDGAPQGTLLGRIHQPRQLEGQLARLETFATMAGLALANVRLYENLQAQVDARTLSLRRAQAALVHSEKMAATGTLVAGLAHEINTPMASILASQNTLRRALDKLSLSGKLTDRDERLVDVVTEAGETIQRGTARMTAILDTLKRFSRLDASSFDQVDLSAIVEDALMVVKHRLEGATLRADLAPGLELRCSPGQISQLLLNLLLNAADAVAEGGTIVVRTRRQGDGAALLEIADDGRGIAPEVLARIFDPGFTTKGVGVGSGMGLGICERIAQDHGGTIQVTSAPGEGTTVTVILPTSPH